MSYIVTGLFIWVMFVLLCMFVLSWQFGSIYVYLPFLLEYRERLIEQIHFYHFEKAILKVLKINIEIVG